MLKEDFTEKFGFIQKHHVVIDTSLSIGTNSAGNPIPVVVAYGGLQEQLGDQQLMQDIADGFNNNLINIGQAPVYKVYYLEFNPPELFESFITGRRRAYLHGLPSSTGIGDDSIH